MTLPLPLSANPLALIRGLPTKKIPLDQIVTKEGAVTDEIFLNKYLGYLKGKVTIYATRMPLSRIRPGFWRPSNPGFEYICDNVTDDDVRFMEDLIRLGDRSALHVYPNPNKADPFDFVCPDDVASYRAYESLGIRTPPVILIGKPESLDESGIGIRQYKCTYNPLTSHMDGIVSVTHKMVPSILGTNRPDHASALARLIETVQTTKEKVKNFHRGGVTTLHYHHTLYSVLLRAQETLEAIKLLSGHGLHLNAASLVRTLYELALTFYVDWIAPTQMYRYLQISAVMSEKEWEKYCDETYHEQVKAGLSAYDAKRLKDAKMFGFRLVSVVAEKARLFPLGLEHHKDLYSFLSDITHHDFSMTARYTNTLEHGDESVFNEDAASTTIYCADLFTAAIVARVLDDIGEPKAHDTTRAALSDG
ncbi:DUF5677 domain-containing protein [Pseudothauera rhizosphaerae]|uniref:Uncharacterized protein n=1 Tax=Pseudothauera rhizosphaerae TaxID=2565932 RepID=A0A4S4AUT5_9RHOO|nr:DUF5677 domain-containing protein [Pseudothauera rhizosphaerae]THF63290.1 hypothetical protein E6O51_04265 [Pseudothauera rhizosphaerae]